MLTNSLSTTQVGQCRYTPGRGGGRRAAPFKDLRPPGPSGGRALCAPSYQRQCVASPAPVVVSSAGSGDHDIRYFHRGGVRVYSWAQSATTQSRSASRPSSTAFSVRAVRASCRLTQLLCWVVPGRDSSSSASSGRRVPSFHSKVEFNLAAIPPGTLDLPLRRQAAKSLPGVQDTAVPAVGADSVRHPGAGLWLPPTSCFRAASHRLRGFARISDVTSCIYSKVSACSRSPWYSARPSVLRSLLWAVPAQAGEAVFPPTAPGSSAAPGSPRSPFRGAPEPAALRSKTASPATLHFVPRPMALEDLQAAPASRSEGTPAKSPARTPPPARLPAP